ncbi:TIP-1 family-domain-containing protein [Multifurca ochricompacta]|uniref:TIP-1 family-domain-containing protein n=1 Tax=Multifurca ochricompacta TaxID=376703 RepID=A0AAD4QTW4_9AGAM|nr:TIP-1 family-domain-containing protein [Multifurca ochricompacta]
MNTISDQDQIKLFLSQPDLHISQINALNYLDANHNFSQSTLSLVDALESTRHERDTLRVSLAASYSAIQQSRTEMATLASLRLHSAQELSLLGHSLVDELSSLFIQLLSDNSQATGPPTLLEGVEAMHRILREQESIKAYVQVIKRALQLSEAAVAEISPNPPIVVSNYRSLQSLVGQVKQGCSQASDVTGEVGISLRLVTFLEETQRRTWSSMKAVLSSFLLAASETLHWPMPIDYSTVSLEAKKSFEGAFHLLLDFQEIGEKLHTNEDECTRKDGLYPIQALVQPVSQRFKYHFEGPRQTNKLDKWYFTHILNVSHEHRPFFDNVIQRLLVPTKFRDIDAWREFTSNLLPSLSRHIRRTMPMLLSHPPLLAHTIYQALAFDASLREDGFSLSGTLVGRYADDAEWQGVSEVILGRREWFNRWVEGEKSFALDRYHDILGAKDAWAIADDAAESEDVVGSGSNIDLRPTVSARQLKALVEQVTDRYSPLPNFTQRTRFLIDVQLPLLEGYHSRILSSLDAFESLSSSFVRVVPGALGTAPNIDTWNRGRLTTGVDGIMRLCKALVSARYMSTATEVWGEDLFFLELWTEINLKASLRARAELHPSLPNLKNSSSDVPDGTIFEELVQQYEKLVTRTEEMIVQHICSEVEAAWNQGSGSSHPSDISISPTLLPALSVLSSHLSALRRTVPRATTSSIYRRRAILYRRPREVTDAERKALQREGELWVETCRLVLPEAGERVEVPWRRLLQAGRILGADDEDWAQILKVSFDDLGQEDWELKVTELIYGAELTREEVRMIARTREDCLL